MSKENKNNKIDAEELRKDAVSKNITRETWALFFVSFK
jgi:hypothetical protein